MMWLGDFPEDFATVVCMFTTHDSTGAPVAPLSAFEAADILIYKNGSNAQKTTTNGVTMTSPFDSVTGLHCVVIDTSNDTGDGGFWVAGAVYTIVLSPDETVDGVVVAKVIGQFTLSVIAANVVAIKAKTDNLPSDPADASVIAGLIAAVETKVDTVDTVVDAVKAKTDNLPSDPADASVIAARFDTLDTSVADLPTNAELSAELAGADDAVLTAISALSIPTANQNADALLDRANGVETGFTFRQAMRIISAVLAGKSSGHPGVPVYRDVNDTVDRVSATTLTGNRSSVTLDPN